MKKIITLLFSTLLLTSIMNAQNLVTNPGFESDPATFTVVENTANVLMRVSGLQDVTTQTANPTTTATSIPAGMWVKKSANSGYIKGIVVTSDYYSGSSSLNLRIAAGTTQTGLTSWYNCVNLQRLASGLTSTKKYVATVWAKADDVTDNQCAQLVLFITDNTLKANYTKTISLTGGTTWTQYQTTFDLPTWISNNPTADFSTAFMGLGIVTTYDTANKTLYSGILLDDFSLTEDTSTGLSTPDQTSTVIVMDGNVNIKSIERNQLVNIYNVSGGRVFSKIVTNHELTVPLTNGIYIVNVNNINTKVVVNK